MGVLSVTPIAGHVELRLDEAADPAEVIAKLAARHRLRRAELRRPSLEDIFIELVVKGGGMDDGTDAGGASAWRICASGLGIGCVPQPSKTVRMTAKGPAEVARMPRMFP